MTIDQFDHEIAFTLSTICKPNMLFMKLVKNIHMWWVGVMGSYICRYVFRFCFPYQRNRANTYHFGIFELKLCLAKSLIYTKKGVKIIYHFQNGFTGVLLHSGTIKSYLNEFTQWSFSSWQMAPNQRIINSNVELRVMM